LFATRTVGLFFDPQKLHVLRHKGEYYQVEGPLNVPRPPQGWPVIVQAGASDEGVELAAEFAEAIFSPHLTIEAAKAYYDDVKGRMRKYGRDPDHLKDLAGPERGGGATDAEAAADFEFLQSLIHPVVGREILSTMLGGIDLSPFPMDGPLPDPLPQGSGSKGHYDSIVAMARRESLTIRQLGDRVAGRARQEHHSRQPHESCGLHAGVVRAGRLRRLLRDAALYPGRARRFLQHGGAGAAAPRACSAKTTRARRCASTSACRGPRAATVRRKRRSDPGSLDHLGISI